MSILPKYPCAEMFQCQNVPVLEGPHDEISRCRNVPVPKCPCAEMSGSEISPGPFTPYCSHLLFWLELHTYILILQDSAVHNRKSGNMSNMYRALMWLSGNLWIFQSIFCWMTSETEFLKNSNQNSFLPNNHNKNWWY